MTDELAETLKREYEGGATLENLAARHGLTVYKTRALLLEAGVTLRNAGPATVSATPTMVSAYESGATIVAVGRLYGLSYGVTRRMLLAAGVKFRAPGGR